MKVKCNYCDQLIDDNLKYCPNCGGSMPAINRTASGQPKTIEELKDWYTAHKLPPENVTRFFIGKDIKEPKAFGIYKSETGDYVVYKNKADGERTVRYQGSDEAYAVNELYQRLRAEISDQKSRAASRKKVQRNVHKAGESAAGFFKVIGRILGFLLLTKLGNAIMVLLIVFIFAKADHSPSRGYYRYDGNDYYYQSGSWYSYNQGYDTWDYLSDSDFLDDIIYDETDDDYRIYDHSGMDFEDTSWYDSGSSSSSGSSYDSSDYSYDWDSDYSWDSYDSWDSDYSSWDSDW